MIPLAHVTHAVPGRIRFRIPSMHRVDAYFAALQEALLNLPGVSGVHATPLTSSLLVVFDPKIGEQVIARYALDHELFELQTHESWTATTLTIVKAGAVKLNRKLRTADDERYDKRALLLLLLLILGLRQLREGQIMAPAFNLFWNAYMLFEAMGTKEGSEMIGTPNAPDNVDGD